MGRNTGRRQNHHGNAVIQGPALAGAQREPHVGLAAAGGERELHAGPAAEWELHAGLAAGGEGELHVGLAG